MALDSISEIAEVVLAEEKTKTKDPRLAYGALAEQMTALMRAFRDLPIVVVMIAKEERKTDEATGRTLSVIGMPGAKLTQSVPYMFDEVLRLVVVADKETGARSRLLQTQATETSEAKDRSGKLAEFEAPDLGAVIAKLQNNTNKKASK